MRTREKQKVYKEKSWNFLWTTDAGCLFQMFDLVAFTFDFYWLLKYRASCILWNMSVGSQHSHPSPITLRPLSSRYETNRLTPILRSRRRGKNYYNFHINAHRTKRDWVQEVKSKNVNNILWESIAESKWTQNQSNRTQPIRTELNRAQVKTSRVFYRVLDLCYSVDRLEVLYVRVCLSAFMLVCLLGLCRFHICFWQFLHKVTYTNRHCRTYILRFPFIAQVARSQ